MPNTITDASRIVALRTCDGNAARDTAKSEAFPISDFAVRSRRKEGKVWSELKPSFVGIWSRLPLMFRPTSTVLSRCKSEGILVSLWPLDARLQPDERFEEERRTWSMSGCVMLMASSWPEQQDHVAEDGN